jgi:Domain of unknown function (DUF6249)
MDAEVIIPVVSIVFTIGGSVAAVLVWMSLNYRKRRRLIELHHTERMAAIERGMDVPPLPMELIAGRGRRRRSSLLPGLVWFFIGLAIVGGQAMGNDEDMPWMLGFIPLGIGLAYLIYYFVEGRNVETRLLEHELAGRRSSNQAATPSL